MSESSKPISLMTGSFVKDDSYLYLLLTPFFHEYFVFAEEGLLVITGRGLNATTWDT